MTSRNIYIKDSGMKNLKQKWDNRGSVRIYQTKIKMVRCTRKERFMGGRQKQRNR